MDIQDVQLTKFVNSGNGRILTNAGKAKSYGIEAINDYIPTNEDILEELSEVLA